MLRDCLLGLDAIMFIVPRAACVEGPSLWLGPAAAHREGTLRGSNRRGCAAQPVSASLHNGDYLTQQQEERVLCAVGWRRLATGGAPGALREELRRSREHGARASWRAEGSRARTAHHVRTHCTTWLAPSGSTSTPDLHSSMHHPPLGWHPGCSGSASTRAAVPVVPVTASTYLVAYWQTGGTECRAQVPRKLCVRPVLRCRLHHLWLVHTALHISTGGWCALHYMSRQERPLATVLVTVLGTTGCQGGSAPHHSPVRKPQSCLPTPLRPSVGVPCGGPSHYQGCQH